MNSRCQAAVDNARRVLSVTKRFETETLLEKTIWSSPAGKKRISNRLVAMLPAHKTCSFSQPRADIGLLRDLQLHA